MTRATPGKRRRTLPSGRAIAVLLVAALVPAVLAPPFAPLWILGATAGVLTLAWLDARRAEASFSLTRRIPVRIPQGDEATLEWIVRGGAFGAPALQISEHFPTTFDVRSPLAELGVAPNGIARAETKLTPRRRGTWVVGPSVVRALGPFGFGWREVEVEAPTEVRVDPTVDPLRRLSVDAQRTQWLGKQSRRMRGVGSEFESLRAYRPDDDFRWIDWKASARRRQLTSREYQVDEHRPVHFLLDTGRLMTTEAADRTKLDHALGAALALGWAAMRRGDSLGAIAFDSDVVAELKPGRGRAQSVRFHELISRLQPSLREPNFPAAFVRLSRLRVKRSLVVVFTDLVDELVSESLVKTVALASRRHSVLVVTLTDAALHARVATPPPNLPASYGNAVAADALLLRDQAIGRLRSAGVRVVDAAADRLAAESVEAYLRLRAENRV